MDVAVGTLPAPQAVDFMAEPTTQAVRPLDVIEVSVFGVEDLSLTVQVGADGVLDYPLAGEVPAAGMTTTQVSAELEDRLRSTYVRNPDVTSRIIERAEQLITVGGQIERPGRFPVEAPVTLLEALALGGGITPEANRRELLIFREVDGERYIGIYNVSGIQRGNYPDPMVYPNDIVMVGENEALARVQRVVGIVSSITSPLILLERVLR
ncbi:polysaccharide biosynthesis/export family protein [Aurantiacibacter aquimixticola]|uniref:Polysaccharide export protein n=1 Tax=Aurantiacibacter aquimixticola TaxID=1958945 RepID=A0A419RSI4_9SPHN|nr:polysaccharide biosynthesis/export family protein [Aurantiacibacter aquimixticola]RJY08763.1 polysaccharide export protein [Aurantiacibacter aquimixticola]